jgi:hypothetical protein
MVARTRGSGVSITEVRIGTAPAGAVNSQAMHRAQKEAARAPRAQLPVKQPADERVAAGEHPLGSALNPGPFEPGVLRVEKSAVEQIAEFFGVDVVAQCNPEGMCVSLACLLALPGRA